MLRAWNLFLEKDFESFTFLNATIVCLQATEKTFRNFFGENRVISLLGVSSIFAVASSRPYDKQNTVNT